MENNRKERKSNKRFLEMLKKIPEKTSKLKFPFNSVDFYYLSVVHPSKQFLFMYFYVITHQIRTRKTINSYVFMASNEIFSHK